MLDQTSPSQNACHPDPLLLVSEISHRVVNEYSQVVAGVHLAAEGVSSREAKEVLSSAVTRLLRFAEARRALQAPVCSEDIDLADHLHRLCDSLTASSLHDSGVRVSLSSMATAPPSLCVAVIVGSLRKASISRKLAHALMCAAPPVLRFTFVEICGLPPYNEDLEQDAPPAWTRFRDAVRVCDGVLFVTPEYNRSVPAGRKKALDVESRPSGQSVFRGRPAEVVSQSPGAIGWFGANHAIRQSLVFRAMPVLREPEAYISSSAQLFDDDGGVLEARTQDFLAVIMQAYARWLIRNAPEHALSPNV